ncbi:hypothetical protein [Flavihumibacter petaseus]|uniref:Uncharacterized protein n=1 Tax=Flavihumibacter petaseus NBRC 106054 TaxID=1220578 RepID=A0A0E9N695_9BACT|nr:hypothetical protein [Flavihumibacter petaseus]GAO45452.1 hypothetical protein FPE01S_05_01470 [Flavihumibacter petaseus NBRC 106054]
MKQASSITVDMRVPGGYVEYCRFMLPCDQQIARGIFSRLKTTAETGIARPLRLSLINPEAMPMEVSGVVYCRLDQLAWNCRFITREIFKYHNLE